MPGLADLIALEVPSVNEIRPEAEEANPTS